MKDLSLGDFLIGLIGPTTGEMAMNAVEMKLAQQRQRRKWRLAKRRWRAQQKGRR